jgi:hypothetical protein
LLFICSHPTLPTGERREEEARGRGQAAELRVSEGGLWCGEGRVVLGRGKVEEGEIFPQDTNLSTFTNQFHVKITGA